MNMKYNLKEEKKKCAHIQFSSVTVDDNDHDYANCKLISMHKFDYRIVCVAKRISF